MSASVWQLFIIAGGFFVLFGASIVAAFSKKARGWDKFFWVAVSLLFSWVGYLLYYFIRVRGPGGADE